MPLVLTALWVCVTNTNVPAYTESCVFPIPGVLLKHLASCGHSNLKRLLLPAMLEAVEDGGQGSSTEPGSPRAHSHTHVLHKLSVRGPGAQAQVLQDGMYTGYPSQGARGTGCHFEAQEAQMLPSLLPPKPHGCLGTEHPPRSQVENPLV